jgi:nitrogen regulatory protein P-II 1
VAAKRTSSSTAKANDMRSHGSRLVYRKKQKKGGCNMKKIEAIVRPSKIEELKDALEKIGVVSLTITEVKGRGKQKGITQQWRGTQYVVDMIPKTKMEIVADDAQVDTIVDTILAHARTGQIGDGKIFISTIERVIRVRTGESGMKAL